MARKRMFDTEILTQDSFLDLPMDAKALYFLLGMEADDEGFVNPKKVLRLYGGAEDSIKLLILKNYLIPFKSGVVVITDWRRNNYLDKNRIKATIYQEEKRMLNFNQTTEKYECLTNVKPSLNESEEIKQEYMLNIDEIKENEERLTNVKQMLNQNSIEENSIEESIKEEIIKEESPKELLNCDDDDDDEFINFLQNDCNYIIRGTETEINTINSWRSIDRKIIKYAIEESQRRNITNINYIHKTILNKLEEQKTKEAPVPDWVGKEIKKKPLSSEKEKEMKELLKEFK